METLNIKDDSVSQESIYVKLLKANHNLILHGAPGTGKTYLAKQIAKDMDCPEDEIGFVQFHQSYDYTDFVEGLRPAKGENGKADGFVRKDGVFKEFCKNAIEIVDSDTDCNPETAIDAMIAWFKENYKGEILKNDSTSFTVEITNQSMKVKLTSSGSICSISPKYLKQYLRYGKTTNEKHVTYERIIGEYIQKNYPLQSSIKKKKLEPKNKNFVFIIDEINRGEMSKIFGELFFSIEPSYRGENGKIKTQYQNLVDDDDIFADGFFVPENVYIIGTMNDIDRSVECMDFAMRRRFAFKEIKADDRIEMLTNADKEISQYADEAIQRMQSLNNAIDETEGLSSANDIGPAYFRKIRYYEGDFQQLWDYHIEGVIREYLRGIDESGEKFTKLKNAYFLIEDQAESSDEPIED